jgi:(1->4)-alpha-D-glucan 1-alpha-D-glucosylmutase
VKAPFRVPRATYRLQMHEKFNFEQLANIIPYLDDLGISDAYTSPIFRASPGSTHGYDVCDHNEISPELGGIDGLMRVSGLLKEREMGLLLDFVPNHMGIEGPFNWRWIDVLEHGHESRFASFFDIQWNPRHAVWQDRILVPMRGRRWRKNLSSFPCNSAPCRRRPRRRAWKRRSSGTGSATRCGTSWES